MRELAALVLEDYELNGRKTAWRARNAYKHLALHFDAFPLENWRAKLASYYPSRKAEGAAAATVACELVLLHKGLGLAKRRGLIESVPEIDLPRVQNARVGFVSEDQFTAIRLRLPNPVDDVASFAYISGWRKSEILGLTWDRVDMERGVIRLNPGATKNGAGRTLVFRSHETLKAMMVRLLGSRSGPFVFHRHGKKVRDFRHAWGVACQGAGVPDLIFHDLRRSAARNLRQAGVPEHLIMKLCGWKTASMFRRYDIVAEEDLADALGRLK